jgi:hypothetical protein
MTPEPPTIARLKGHGLEGLFVTYANGARSYCGGTSNRKRKNKMNRSSMLCAFVVGVIAFALTGDHTFAAVNYNSSKSNAGNFVINPGDPNATEKACTDKGGSVSTDPKGDQKICAINKTTSRSNTQHN